MCTINDNHMMYAFWDIEPNEQIFLSFRIILCLFTSLTQKIKIQKNEKTPWRCYHFTHVYHKLQLYDIWFLRYRVWQTDFFVIFNLFLPFYSPKNSKNQNFEKIKKDHLELSSFYTNVPKLMIICCSVPKIPCVTNEFLFYILGYFLPF